MSTSVEGNGIVEPIALCSHCKQRPVIPPRRSYCSETCADEADAPRNLERVRAHRARLPRGKRTAQVIAARLARNRENPESGCPTHVGRVALSQYLEWASRNFDGGYQCKVRLKGKVPAIALLCIPERDFVEAPEGEPSDGLPWATHSLANFAGWVCREDHAAESMHILNMGAPDWLELPDGIPFAAQLAVLADETQAEVLRHTNNDWGRSWFARVVSLPNCKQVNLRCMHSFFVVETRDDDPAPPPGSRRHHGIRVGI
jgi:hypothetical protein